MARNAKSHQKVEEKKKRFFPGVFRGGEALLTSWFQVSDILVSDF